LKDLLNRGWIVENAPRRDAPALAGKRAKIVYTLTAEGKERFPELAADSGPSTWEDENFGVRLAFFGRTDAAVRLRILEGRRSRLEERMERVRGSLSRTRERLDAYTLELQRHGLESVEREVRWLNELIRTEQRADAEPATRSATNGTEQRAEESEPRAAGSELDSRAGGQIASRPSTEK
jgi:DNA-binding PadR family transcriptional regulator